VAETIRRAWLHGVGPGDSPNIDLHSTICEVHGKAKGGAGSSQRGTGRFVEELIARVHRAGATSPLVVRADSGFFSYALVDTLNRLEVSWSITVKIDARIRACIEAIDESTWQTIFYPDGGVAQVAETIYVTGIRGNARSLRLVVRRTRLVDSAQATPLYPILLTSLIYAADRVESTTGVQMAYVKQWAPRSFNQLELRVPELYAGPGVAIRDDACQITPNLPKVDLVYLDPPYNQHRYFTNYHIWEALVTWDAPAHYGTASLRWSQDTTRSTARRMPTRFLLFCSTTDRWSSL